MTKSVAFEQNFQRLRYLQRWYELAIRPDSREACHDEDLDLFIHEVDQIKELENRCLRVRIQMNESIPEPEKALDDMLQVRESTIIGAGKGLFFEPQNHFQTIEAGTVLCYYTGHQHNYQSARHLNDRSYLMCISGDFLVDSGPCPHIKARYINDPLNEIAINCKFVPDLKNFRSIAIATRTIHAGDEIFASYGDGYWAQHTTKGNVLKSLCNLVNVS